MSGQADNATQPPADLIEAVARVVREVRAECQASLADVVTRAELAAAADVSRALQDELADRLRAEFDDLIRRALASEEYATTLAAAVSVVGTGTADAIARASERATTIAGLVERLADDLAATRAELDALRDQRRGLADAVAALATPTPWTQGGIGYRERALVLHHGGLWVACEDTHDAPGAGGAWALVADGLAALEARSGAPGALALVCTFASGRVVELAAPLPRWTARGLWSAEAEYCADDLVTFDGCTWLALTDAPAAAPPSAGWQVVAMRGARGRRGDPGEPGAPGPAGPRGPRGASAPTVDNGIALRAWRGAWNARERYEPGDLVVAAGGTFLCTADPAGEMPRAGASSWAWLAGGSA